MSEKGSCAMTARRVSVWRVLLFGLLLSLLLAAELYAHHAVFPGFIEYLRSIDHKSTAWIANQLSFMLPFITLAVFQCAAYAKAENGDGVMQREKMWEIVLVAVLIYGALLPYVRHYSDTVHEAALAAAVLAGETLPKTPGGVDQTILLEVFEWFFRLTVPLMLLGLYHGSRAERETREYAAAGAAGHDTQPVTASAAPAQEVIHESNG